MAASAHRDEIVHAVERQRLSRTGRRPTRPCRPRACRCCRCRTRPRSSCPFPRRTCRPRRARRDRPRVAHRDGHTRGCRLVAGHVGRDGRQHVGAVGDRRRGPRHAVRRASCRPLRWPGRRRGTGRSRRRCCRTHCRDTAIVPETVPPAGLLIDNCRRRVVDGDGHGRRGRLVSGRVRRPRGQHVRAVALPPVAHAAVNGAVVSGPPSGDAVHQELHARDRARVVACALPRS